MYISFVIRDSKVCSEPSLSANCIDQAGLELSDLLPQLPKYWNYNLWAHFLIQIKYEVSMWSVVRKDMSV